MIVQIIGWFSIFTTIILLLVNAGAAMKDIASDEQKVNMWQLSALYLICAAICFK